MSRNFRFIFHFIEMLNLDVYRCHWLGIHTDGHLISIQRNFSPFISGKLWWKSLVIQNSMWNHLWPGEVHIQTHVFLKRLRQLIPFHSDGSKSPWIVVCLSYHHVHIPGCKSSFSVTSPSLCVSPSLPQSSPD